MICEYSKFKIMDQVYREGSPVYLVIPDDFCSYTLWFEQEVTIFQSFRYAFSPNFITGQEGRVLNFWTLLRPFYFVPSSKMFGKNSPVALYSISCSLQKIAYILFQSVWSWKNSNLFWIGLGQNAPSEDAQICVFFFLVKVFIFFKILQIETRMECAPTKCWE